MNRSPSSSRYPWFIGLGCGLILLLLLIPASFAALALGFRILSPQRQVRIQPTPYVERVPGATQPQDQPSGNAIDQNGGQGTGAEAFDTDLTALYRQVNPGVVNISVQITQGSRTGAGAGSGFIIDDRGYIVTNNHVVLGASTVIVGFSNGLEARAEVVGTDLHSDLAVIKVESIPEGAHALPLGDSDQVQVGQRVVAIGNPFQLGSTMTYGIVSAVGRVIPSLGQFNIPRAIQTDAAINPGNSGGPLLNLQGEVIGVNAQIETGNTGIAGNIGIGFAIPSNILKLVSPSLIETGTYEWPWLGVTGIRVSELVQEANQLQTQQGAYIDSIVENSPALKAGLQGSTGATDVDGIPVPTGGDVVIAMNGEPVTNFDDLLTRIAFSKPGDQVTLSIIRNGEQIEVPVTLEPRPANAPEPTVPEIPPSTP